MEFLIGGRQSGKTYRAVDWLRSGDRLRDSGGFTRVLVTFSEHDAERLRSEYRLDKEQAMSVWALHAARGKNFRDVRLAVDNLDLMINQLIGQPVGIDLITATGEATLL